MARFWILFLLSELFVKDANTPYMFVFGGIGIFFGLLTLVVFFVNCPSCNKKLFLPPWKRAENSISPKEQIINGLIHKNWVCGSCGTKLND